MSTTVSKIWTYYLFQYLLKREIYYASSAGVSWQIYEFFRSSHRRYFMKKHALKNSAIFTGKLHVCNSNTVVFLWILRNFQKHLFRRASVSGCVWFLKTATKQQWVAASVLTLLLSSHNLLTRQEQWSINNSILTGPRTQTFLPQRSNNLKFQCLLMDLRALDWSILYILLACVADVL